jgi:hypothetical protein
MVFFFIITCAGRVFVADQGNHRIQVFALDNGKYIKTLIGNPQGGSGAAGADYEAGLINKPQGLGLDIMEKLLYVCEGGNKRVLAVSIADETWGKVRGVLGDGTRQAGEFAAFADDSRPPSAAACDSIAPGRQFGNPVNVTVDAEHGIVYVVDEDLHQVQMFSSFVRFKAGSMVAVATGETALAAAAGVPSRAETELPEGSDIGGRPLSSGDALDHPISTESTVTAEQTPAFAP